MGMNELRISVEERTGTHRLLLSRVDAELSVENGKGDGVGGVSGRGVLSCERGVERLFRVVHRVSRVVD